MTNAFARFAKPKGLWNMQDWLMVTKATSNGVGGGYVFNAIHNVQPLTPIENLIAMLDAFKEFNGEK